MWESYSMWTHRPTRYRDASSGTADRCGTAVTGRPDGRCPSRRWKAILQSHYGKEEYFATSHNERFRRQLYDVYLGGLDSEKFPLLFKRAIPFRMNIRLEDFVKEYICMEQDIHIDDMQESVMQYGRMRKRLKILYTEISILKEMQEKYGLVLEKEETIQKNGYFTGKLEILELMERAGELTDKAALSRDDLQNQENA